MSRLKKNNVLNSFKNNIEIESIESIILPKNEYAHVMSELNTNLTKEEREKHILVKPIGDFYYTIENNGFNNYRIIGKHRIVDEIISDWSGNYE